MPVRTAPIAPRRHRPRRRKQRAHRPQDGRNSAAATDPGEHDTPPLLTPLSDENRPARSKSCPASKRCPMVASSTGSLQTEWRRSASNRVKRRRHVLHHQHRQWKVRRETAAESLASAAGPPVETPITTTLGRHLRRSGGHVSERASDRSDTCAADRRYQDWLLGQQKNCLIFGISSSRRRAMNDRASLRSKPWSRNRPPRGSRLPGSRPRRAR